MSRGPVDPRLLRHSRVARAGIARLAAVGTAQAVVSLGVVVLLVQVVTGMVAAGSVAVHTLWLLAGLLAGRALLAWAEQVLAARTGARVVDELRDRLLHAVLDRGPAAVAAAGPHRVTMLLDTGLDALRPWFTGYLPSLVTAAVLPPLVVLMIAWTDLRSAAVVLVTLPLVPVFAVLLGRATQRRAAERHAADVRLGAHFLDVVRGLPTLRLLGRADRQVAAVAGLTDQHRTATLRVLRLAFLSSTALDLVGTLSVGLVAVEAGLRVAAGGLALPDALLVILLAPEAYRPLREVGARFHAAADATAVVDEVDRWLSPGPAGPDPASGPEHGTRPVGVSVRGLRVRHPGRVVDALDLPELTVRGGELVVLRGPSGVGKTTALRVLAGIQPAGAGQVEVHGPPPLLLPQRPFLPHARTVADLTAGIDRDTLAATGLAPADDAGLGERALGEAGLGLSAGQRQRLALARLLADAGGQPRVVLLDEPTAHLDRASEARVVSTLRGLADAGCAVVAVAHRPALPAAADRVVDVRPPARPDSRSEPPAPTTPVEPTTPAAPPAGGPTRRRVQARFGAGTAVALGAAATLTGLTLTAAATWLLVQASTMPPVLSLSTAVVLVRASAVARPLLRWLERLVAHDVAFRRLARWRSAVYATLVPRVPGPATTAGRRGELLTRIGSDVDARVDGLLRGTLPTLGTGLAMLAAVTAAWLALPAAALAAAVGLAVAGLVAPWLGVRLTAADRTAATRARLADALVETVDAVEELAGRPRAEALAVPLARSRALRAARLQDAVRSGAGLALGHVGIGVALVGTAVAAGQATGIGATTAAVLVLATAALTDPVLGLVDAAIARRRAGQARARLAALAATPAPAAPQPVRIPEPGLVEVRGLAAGWGPAAAVTGIDLTVRPGGRVAVTGPSGCGKSTLAAVLTGFLAPAAGTVRVGGRVGLVSADAGHVFASTVRENLRPARPDADDATLCAAVTAARLDNWLTGLPAGLDSWLGEGGTTMSGGEVRRLLLARALLTEPDVLVLDEPTEGLDEPTAQALLTDLLAAGRTVVLLTHRTEGLDLVDHVLDLARQTAPERNQNPSLAAVPAG